ncbi:MAG TPA: lanthionine synthetase LanC family protein [Longimicrobium sp.]|nr:lanthionine synthetase LanC family protein [Longimicrobium sp.]
MTDLFLESAARIGHRLAARAAWSGAACAWTILVLDRASREALRGVPRVTGGSVYNGTAGIALFLLELHRLTGDAAVRRAAEGALRHALADPHLRPPARFAFHAGRVGVAWTLARAARVLERDEWLAEAAALLAPMAGLEGDDPGLDVVGGAAGAIPALLQLAPLLGPEHTTETAVRLGERLIERARREPGGWSWDGAQGVHARNLCGLAHGAAGMGHALVELFHATGDARFRWGAEQAFAYEREFFIAGEGHWPDLRHDAMSEYLGWGRVAELALRVRAGERSLPYTPHVMNAWCHGAAGIALTRLRAWEVLGTPVYRDEAEAATEAAARSLRGGTDNFSLCHGAAGNAEPLLHAAEVLGRPELRARAEEAAREGCERYEMAGRPWRCGVLGRASDPALMMGEAGIGHFLLRLHDPATPPVLLLRAPAPPAELRLASIPAAEALRRGDAAVFFPRTLALLARAGRDGGLFPPLFGGAPEGAPEAAFRALPVRIAAEPDAALRERLEDAFAVEGAAYEGTRAIADFTEEYLWTLVSPASRPVDWEGGELRLAPHARVVEARWEGGAEGAPGRVFHLLIRAGNRVRTRVLSPLSGLVLRVLEEAPGRAAEVAARVAALGATADAGALEAKVRAQLAQAHAAGLVEGAPAAVAAR